MTWGGKLGKSTWSFTLYNLEFPATDKGFKLNVTSPRQSCEKVRSTYLGKDLVRNYSSEREDKHCES